MIRFECWKDYSGGRKCGREIGESMYRKSQVKGTVSKKTSKEAGHDTPGRNNEGQDQGDGSDITYFLVAGLAAHMQEWMSVSFPVRIMVLPFSSSPSHQLHGTFFFSTWGDGDK